MENKPEPDNLVQQDNTTKTPLEDVNAYNLVTEGDSEFDILVIKPNNIDDFDWKDGNYLNYI